VQPATPAPTAGGSRHASRASGIRVGQLLAPRLFNAERNLVTAWLYLAMPDQLDALIIQSTLRGRVLDQLIECLCHALIVRLRGVVCNRRDEVDRPAVGIPARSRSVFSSHSDPFS